MLPHQFDRSYKRESIVILVLIAGLHLAHYMWGWHDTTFYIAMAYFIEAAFKALEPKPVPLIYYVIIR